MTLLVCLEGSSSSIVHSHSMRVHPAPPATLLRTALHCSSSQPALRCAHCTAAAAHLRCAAHTAQQQPPTCTVQCTPHSNSRPPALRCAHRTAAAAHLHCAVHTAQQQPPTCTVQCTPHSNSRPPALRCAHRTAAAAHLHCTTQWASPVPAELPPPWLASGDPPLWVWWVQWQRGAVVCRGKGWGQGLQHGPAAAAAVRREASCLVSLRLPPSARAVRVAAAWAAVQGSSSTRQYAAGPRLHASTLVCVRMDTNQRT